MAGSTSISRISEAINVRLTEFNYTSTNIPQNQRGLYLRPGEYQLSNCLLNDGQEITDNQTIFSIQILYEKPVGECVHLLIHEQREREKMTLKRTRSLFPRGRDRNK